ncbi:protein PAXX [Tiliqua scincoides]|uniref:protein PAXX n=1 Tax=Tiliqua scincoides TaxID=71010 RepID=UPI0034631E2A
MAPPGPLRAVQHDGQRFLCFCSPGGDPLRLHVTNASEFWSCDVESDNQDGDVSRDELGSSTDSSSKLREALAGQEPTLTVRDSKAVLQFQNGGQVPLTFDLFRLPLSEARKQLQELMFGLVEQVQTLEKRLQETAVPSPNISPEKNTWRNPGLFAAELSPPKSRAGQAATKRRLPGESLINPGFKSKKAPTGVDFDDL